MRPFHWNYRSFIFLSLLCCTSFAASIVSNSSSEAAKIADWFLGNKTDKSYCPHLLWLKNIARNTSSSFLNKSLVYVNIGYNKGYNFGELLYYFAPWTSINSASWYRCLRSANPRTFINRARGACNEGYAKPLKDPSPASYASFPMKLFGVDLNEGNKKLVTNTFRCLQGGWRGTERSNMKNISYHIITAAGLFLFLFFRYL